ncbi:MAG TPA: SRPBCC family protein [Candidatus Limnocylindrales bacterium]|jgi:uncharacterized protein YndB with AHSA1/START domain
MIEVAWSVGIGRLPEDVFRHVADIERYPDWQRATGIVGVRRTDDGPLGPGSRFVIERLVRGNRGSVDCVVTAVDPGRRFAFRGRDSSGFDVETEIDLAPAGMGSRLDWRFRMTTPGLLSLAGGMLRREVLAAAESDFTSLKRMLEQVAS